MIENERIRIIVVEPDNVIRNGLLSILNENPKFNCIGGYSGYDEVLQNFKSDQPDVILMELDIPGMSSTSGIRKIRKRNPTIDVIVFNNFDDEKIFQALCAGARSYIIKNSTPGKLNDSIIDLYDGMAEMSTSIAKKTIDSFKSNLNSSLNEKESNVLLSIANGNSYAMTGEKLKTDKNEVKSIIKNIYQKLNLSVKVPAAEN